MTDAVNLWSNDEHAAQYLERADAIPHRAAGEAALVEWIPQAGLREVGFIDVDCHWKWRELALLGGRRA